MTRIALARRPFAVLVCILQLVAGGPLALADAWAEGSSTAARTAHVEAEGSPACPPAHAPDCVVCRQLTTLAGPSDGPSAGFGTLARSAPPVAGTGVAPATRIASATLPRAPPLS